MSGAKAELRARLMDGVRRSATVVVSNQVNSSLRRYLGASGLLLAVLSGHVIMCAVPGGVEGFNAPWRVLKGLVQSLVVQLVVGYLTEGQAPETALLNLVGLLVAGGGVRGVKGWAEEDLAGLYTSASYIVSDQISTILRANGVPLVGASLGVFFGGEGLLGSTLSLTGVNALCSAAFEAVRAASSLAVAWPVMLLYFVHEAARRFEKAEALLNFGMYKASDAAYAGLALQFDPGELSLLFFFLVAAGPGGDGVWTGVCALALVRAVSDWFLLGLAQATQADALLGGLCVLTVLHFAMLVMGGAKK